jgi:hypothetical protein
VTAVELPAVVSVQEYTAKIAKVMQTVPARLDKTAQQHRFGRLEDLHVSRADRLKELAAEAPSEEIAAALRVAEKYDRREAKAWVLHAKGVEKQHG